MKVISFSKLLFVSITFLLTLSFNVGLASEANINVIIDEPSEGISQALLQHYTNSGIDKETAVRKMYEELKNPVFYRDGRLQDLVHIGDIIVVTQTGSVISFNESSNVKASRLPDTLNISENGYIEIGLNKISLPDGVNVNIISNSVDQHNNLIITDTLGVQNKIVAYNNDTEIYVNGESVDITKWLTSKFDIEKEQFVISNKDLNTQTANLSGFYFTPSCSPLSYILIILVLIAILYYFLNKYENNKVWIIVGVVLVGIILLAVSLYNCSLVLPLLALVLLFIIVWEYREKFGIRN